MPRGKAHLKQEVARILYLLVCCIPWDPQEPASRTISCSCPQLTVCTAAAQTGRQWRSPLVWISLSSPWELPRLFRLLSLEAFPAKDAGALGLPELLPWPVSAATALWLSWRESAPRKLSPLCRSSAPRRYVWAAQVMGLMCPPGQQWQRHGELRMQPGLERACLRVQRAKHECTAEDLQAVAGTRLYAVHNRLIVMLEGTNCSAMGLVWACY